MKAEKIKEIIISCLDEMYQASDPPITWAEIEKQYEGVKDWFWKHEIGEKKYDEIRAKYKKMLPPYARGNLDFDLLNYAPKFKKEE